MNARGFPALLILAISIACGESSAPADLGAVSPRTDLGVADLGAADAGPEDLGTVDLGPKEDLGTRDSGPPGYAFVPPSAMAPDAGVLLPSTWVEHWRRDIRPFWMQEDALGTPPGNYPTYRGRTGTPQLPTERRPRMISRQIYAYSMGYLMTGEAELIRRAQLGVRWLLDHAVDPRGGCHERLTETGQAIPGPKYAQDTAYCALGLGAYFFVTRDREAEAGLLALRDLLFDPNVFWDAENQRIRDGMSPDLSAEVDQSRDGGWELVAQLDAINGFMLLVQPVLHDARRRDQFLADLNTLSKSMVRHFWEDGIFWGVSTRKGQYRTRHVDYGHTLKAYWMILEVDKRLPDHPFQLWLDEHLDPMMHRAFDGRRWMKRPSSDTRSEPGSDWWIYAEADQIAATRNLAGGDFTDLVRSTSGNWLNDYVDEQWGFEVFTGINAVGQPVYQGPPSDTFKCNEWKNGYHSTEHALVMYLHAAHRSGTPAELSFAVPAAETGAFVARPYYFHGTVQGRTMGSTLAAGSETLQQVRVTFDEIY